MFRHECAECDNLPYRDAVGGDTAIRIWQQSGVTLPVLASALASIITGTALVATRFVVSGSDGLTIATLRYVVAAACLLPLFAIFDRKNVTLRDFFPIAGLGLLYFGFFPWCISAAMRFTTASGGAIVLACTPAATLLLGKATGSEEWSARKGFGVVFAFLGAAIAVGHIGFDFTATAWRGNLAMILAALLGAIYAIFSKPYLNKYSPLVVTAIAMGAGAFGLSVVWAAIDLSSGLPHLDSIDWLSIVYIGIAGGALSFFLYAWALGQTAPTTTMILLPLNPIAAVIAGAFFLNETLSLGLFVGLALVVAGIVLVVDLNGKRALPVAGSAGQ
jgi:drug/metabolite transporter (DMT)-like permease